MTRAWPNDGEPAGRRRFRQFLDSGRGRRLRRLTLAALGYLLIAAIAIAAASWLVNGSG
jgi:hypothetical protein